MNNKRKKIEGLGRVVLVLSCLVGMEKTRAAVAFTPDVDYAARAVPDLPAFPAGIRPLPVDMGQRAAPAPLVAAVPAAGSAVEAITRLAQTRILDEARAGAMADAICGAVIRLIGEGLAVIPGVDAPAMQAYYESFTDAGGAATANVTAVRDMIQAALLDGVTAADAGFVRAVMATAQAAASAQGPRDAAAINRLAQTRILDEARAGAMANAICGDVIRLIGEVLVVILGVDAPAMQAYYDAFTLGAVASPNVTSIRDLIQAALVVTAADADFVRAVMATAQAAASAQGPRDAAAIGLINGPANDDLLFDSTATLNALVDNDYFSRDGSAEGQATPGRPSDLRPQQVRQHKRTISVDIMNRRICLLEFISNIRNCAPSI